ncbi:hypothetical protein FGB62_48g078 [Gracilaria domingensis]|nr:hypothetical protein FGB62_48g078 [Gracilaria domingensis]
MVSRTHIPSNTGPRKNASKPRHRRHVRIGRKTTVTGETLGKTEGKSEKRATTMLAGLINLDGKVVRKLRALRIRRMKSEREESGGRREERREGDDVGGSRKAGRGQRKASSTRVSDARRWQLAENGSGGGAYTR